jgi:hypothetical protein
VITSRTRGRGQRHHTVLIKKNNHVGEECVDWKRYHAGQRREEEQEEEHQGQGGQLWGTGVKFGQFCEAGVSQSSFQAQSSPTTPRSQHIPFASMITPHWGSGYHVQHRGDSCVHCQSATSTAQVPHHHHHHHLATVSASSASLGPIMPWALFATSPRMAGHWCSCIHLLSI